MLLSKTFIIGDIHGCYDELISLTQQLSLKDDDLLIAVGDIVDRGPKSTAVYHFLKDRPNTIVLMGNHERKHLHNILSYAQEIVKYQFGQEYPAFLKWLRTLPYYYEIPEAIVVHAAFENELPLNAQDEAVLSGTTSGERHLNKQYNNLHWTTRYTGQQPIIYGHEVVGEQPLIAHNTYGIDTGACHGGYLTAIELPGFIIHQVKAEKDHWKTERKLWQLPVLKQRDWDNLAIDDLKLQVQKFSYQPDEALAAFLTPYANFLKQLPQYYADIKTKIDGLSQQLVSQEEDFTAAALKYSFSSYLFKSRNNKLTIADLEKGLNTRKMVMAAMDI